MQINYDKNDLNDNTVEKSNQLIRMETRCPYTIESESGHSYLENLGLWQCKQMGNPFSSFILTYLIILALSYLFN